MKRFFTLLIAFTALFCAVLFPTAKYTAIKAQASETKYIYVNQGFNLIDETFLGMADEPIQDEYQAIMGSDRIFNWIGGRSILSFYSGHTMIATDPEKAIFEDSPSLVLYNQVDTRAWMLSDLGLYPDPAISMEITFRIDNLGFTKDGETDADGNPIDSVGTFQFCITEDTANGADQTGNEYCGGKLFIVTATEEEGVYQLKNNVDEPIAKLNKGEVYKLGIVFDGTDQYYFFLNDEYVAGSQSTFKVPVTLISAFRFDMYSVANPTSETFSEVTLGKILFDTCDLYDEDELDEPTIIPTAKPTVPPTATPTPTPVPTIVPTDVPVITQTVNNTEDSPATDPSSSEDNDADSDFKDDSDLDSEEQETNPKGTVFLIAIAGVIVAFLFIAIIIEKKISNQ